MKLIQLKKKHGVWQDSNPDTILILKMSHTLYPQFDVDVT